MLIVVHVQRLLSRSRTRVGQALERGGGLVLNCLQNALFLFFKNNFVLMFSSYMLSFPHCRGSHISHIVLENYSLFFLHVQAVLSA